MDQTTTRDRTVKDRLGHAAARAWGALGGRPVSLAQIKGLVVTEKSMAFRLKGVGQDGSAVIGKRIRRGDLLVERTVYEEILPQIPVPSLRYYGFAEEPEDEWGWLFLEDAGEENYSSSVEGHRLAAARWLAAVHGTPLPTNLHARLADRGPDHYCQELQSALGNIAQHRGNPALTAEDQAVLTSIVSQCEKLAANWHCINKFCKGMPPVLVHGDLGAKNLRIRNGPSGDVLLAFDWETVGWGVPGVDLAQKVCQSASPDLAVYALLIRRSLPRFPKEDVRHLASIGTVFRLLAAIHWETVTLASKWVEDCMADLRLFQKGLADMARVIG